MRVLKPHQERNFEILLESLKKYCGALDASDTGTGKSATFLALCRAIDARPAIITRKAVIPGWRDECAAMGVEPCFVTNYEAAKFASFPFGRVVETGRRKNASTGKEDVTRKYEWNVSGRVLFCFDEVQACRGTGSLNTKMLLDAAAKYKVSMLSATPFTDPTEAYGIGRALRLFKKDDWSRWQWHHGVRKDPFGIWDWIGNSPNPKKQAEGLKIMEELHREIFPSRGCRTRRSEIPGFPLERTVAQAVEVDEPGEIERRYYEMLQRARLADWERARAAVPDDLQDLAAPLAVTLVLRARQEAELLKCSAIEDMARLAVENGESVAVFVNFDHTIEALRQRLNCNCVVRGDGSGRTGNNFDRVNAVRAFQNNVAPVIIVNNYAGGAGISLHDPNTQRPRTCLISPPWSAVVLQQVLGRTHRLGGGFSSRKLLFAAGTVEERVLKRVQFKTDCLDMLTDGDLDAAVVNE